MAGGPSSKSGLSALLIVVPLALFLAWSQRAEGPSRSELAQALHDAGRGEIHAGDLRDLECTAMATGYACRWRQREGKGWRERRGDVFIADGTWRIAPDP